MDTMTFEKAISLLRHRHEMERELIERLKIDIAIEQQRDNGQCRRKATTAIEHARDELFTLLVEGRLIMKYPQQVSYKRFTEVIEKLSDFSEVFTKSIKVNKRVHNG
jgi:dissimilatory sulfite reductase (desulfoviridin) alpha/beta subunit